MNHELLELPWKVQLVLASGYAGYLLAYIGIRGHHRPVEIAAVSLIFSLIASFALFVLGRAAVGLVDAPLADEYGAVVIGPAVVLLTLLSAGLWRRWVRGWWVEFLRRWRISWSDDDPSALHTVTSNTRFPVTQVGVLLDDGTWLLCSDTHQFKNAPLGPMQLGPNGDVALYVTEIQAADGAIRTVSGTNDPDWGHRISYVPAHRIRQLNLRHGTPG